MVLALADVTTVWMLVPSEGVGARVFAPCGWVGLVQQAKELTELAMLRLAALESKKAALQEGHLPPPSPPPRVANGVDSVSLVEMPNGSGAKEERNARSGAGEVPKKLLGQLREAVLRSTSQRQRTKATLVSSRVSVRSGAGEQRTSASTLPPQLPPLASLRDAVVASLASRKSKNVRAALALSRRWRPFAGRCLWSFMVARS